VPHLQALPAVAQARFLADLARLGQVVYETTGALRINYAIFGNVEPALHAHVLPRYVDEPESLRKANPWAYDWKQARAFDAGVDGPLLEAMRARLGVPV
jgi:diadenosine tetraphosphate (Ap4A) HIT family hydrolase